MSRALFRSEPSRRLQPSWWPRALSGLLAVAWFSLAPRAHAYPIAPQTLWELTTEAQLVVWADVEELSDRPRLEGEQSFYAGGSLAHLKIREVWKGSAPRGGRLQVAFVPGMSCPAPDRYEKGLAVIAFLKQEDGEWHTVGLSYGTRYPTSNGELDAYRRAVKGVGEAQQQARLAQWAGRALDVAGARIDWQVLAAEHPATRWDGLYGLVPDADLAHAFYDRRARPDMRLSPAQRQRLARAFVEHPPRAYDLPMMLTALRGHRSEEVDRTAASAFETVLSTERLPFWAQQAFELLRERYGERPQPAPQGEEDPLLRALEDGASGPGGRQHEAARALRQEWDQFKRRHRLAPALLPLPAEPAVPGTGGDTTL